MSNNAPKKILIAPLDWGLGHTARCVPIISYILSQGHIPVVAGNAAQRSFIEETFGDIDFIHLDGYNIVYSNANKWAQAGLLSQLPQIKKTIAAENKWLADLCQSRQIDGIISDNRYGLYHNKIPSVIITHQLQVQTGFGALANNIVRYIHHKYLGKFWSVWVPDVQDEMHNLAGKLSHSIVKPVTTQYIGLLSRFAGKRYPATAKKYLLVLLSGPEPARTELQTLLLQQLANYAAPVVFVAGSETAAPPASLPANITWHNRLPHQQLGPILAGASMVICRSGYSTLMDLAALNKRAILIPTPGQTEQEYLAKRMMQKQAFMSVKQNKLDIATALTNLASAQFSLLPTETWFSQYTSVLDTWLASLQPMR